MKRVPTPLRRLGLVVLVFVALAGPSAATLWAWTPSGADIQERVAGLTASYGVPLLAADEVPDVLAKAVVATEDERFYSHHGVDSLGLARAVLYDVANACFCQGGSTITEQLVKDVYLGGSDRGYNKLEDMAVALKVEGVLTKRQIMADYLSEINTGFGKFGVTAAACAYYQAPLGGLTLGQYAMLAGVAQAPAVYDPTINPDAARERRSEVLAAMVTNQFITPAQARSANAEPVLDRG
ncbi:MAG TPA: biosynthetic peptidoglycan transglycosylase, partial [Candidatus Dormibacteraeota bacterium]|nr:biosynthetic peptidoglycan transglycosylase [Candidatus Dormibacteraeota bacterium]